MRSKKLKITKLLLTPLALLPLVAASTQTRAEAVLENVDVSGFIGLETRVFTDTPRFNGQKTGAEVSVIFNPELDYVSGKHQFSFIPFYRQDSRDDERSHFDVREAYWLYTGSDWEFLAGINKVFWGVTESLHLANIINQTDGVEDIDGEDYLGQPMIYASKYTDYGQFGVYVLPGFRERTFPGTNGRFRAALPVDTDNVQFESGAEEKHIDFAARWSHYIGEWDLGLSYFYGTGREPVLSPNQTGTRLVPFYEIINQAGLDLQYTREAWLWKLEAIVREGQGDTFAAAIGGFEYTFYQVMESAADVGVLLEYNYDDRDGEAPVTLADDNIFAGVRLALNDIQDTAVLAGVSYDHDTAETFYNLEAERRFGENYTAELRVRILGGSDPDELGYAFEKDDYIQLRISRHF